MDLQLFAEEEGRTYSPTERKLRRARERGFVPKSQELTPSIILIAQLLLISTGGYTILTVLYKLIYDGLFNINSRVDILAHFGSLFYLSTKIVLPLLLVSFFICLLVEILQVGGLRFTPLALAFNPHRLKFDLLKFIKRLLPSKLSLVEYSKSIFKIFIISYIGYKQIKTEYSSLLYALDTDIMPGICIFANLIFKILLHIGIFLVIMAIFDYLYQRHEYKQTLMMTPHELKEEYKLSEGDPYVRARLRQMQRELSSTRTLPELLRADIVITNPIRLAIALRYDPSYMRAPMVVVKAKGYKAERIIQIAIELGIPVVENKPLAEALYNLVDIGQEIPPQLYEAVAEILAYVYRQKTPQ